jgi:ankyrin repeat protein
MICAAKNDEKEVFAKLVQNAKELKNLLDNFIISIIDEENHSLLHYLVVWGYDAAIQLLETVSTLETTLTNKRNFTPVHFAAYLGRHQFLELLLKKTGNVERSKLLGKIGNAIHNKRIKDAQIDNLMGLLEDGEEKAEQDAPFEKCYFNVNELLVSSLIWGTQSQYDDSRRVIENFSQIKFPSAKQSEIGGNHEMDVEATKDFDAQK